MAAANKGMTEFVSNGETMIVNDPNVADEFSSEKSGGYEKGERVYYEGKLYVFTVAHTGAWNVGHVRQILIGEEIKNLDERTKELEDDVVIATTAETASFLGIE